jgi:hypothetical protein
VIIRAVFLFSLFAASEGQFRAIAGEGNGVQWIRGSGQILCSEYTRLRVSDTYFENILEWTYGFWSGANISLGSKNDTVMRNLFDRTVNVDALKARVEAYCFENPDKRIMDAAIEFYFLLPYAADGEQ